MHTSKKNANFWKIVLWSGEIKIDDLGSESGKGHEEKLPRRETQSLV